VSFAPDLVYSRQTGFVAVFYAEPFGVGNKDIIARKVQHIRDQNFHEDIGMRGVIYATVIRFVMNQPRTVAHFIEQREN
jgi:hypothetical protein